MLQTVKLALPLGGGWREAGEMVLDNLTPKSHMFLSPSSVL